MADMSTGSNYRSSDLNIKAIIDGLKSAYVQSRTGKEFKQKKTFSPSTVGYGHGTCARYWYIAFTGAEFDTTIDPSGAANMDNGIHSHTRLQELWQKTGMVNEVERKIVTTDPPVFGFIDLDVTIDGVPAIGEIKTSKHEAFVMRKASMKPYDSHLLQVLLYMWATDRKVGFIMYEDKNNHDFVIVPIERNERNETFLQNVLDWLRVTRRAWEDNSLPTRPVARKNAKICKSCPVYDTCWSELGDGDIDLPALEVKS